MLDRTEAAACLPLLVGDRVVGAVAATFPTRRDFDAGERRFLLSLAGQVATSFERAALADARREIAETLQRSLLPRSLPRLDRLGVTARYLPGARGTRAGGDWYDVLPLGDGRVAVAVGDVVGNGAPAAAVMGQLRSALAAVLLEGHPPARALGLLDRFAEQVDGASVSTVACLRLDPAAGRLTYSVAGHLPPLVLGATGARYLEGGWGPALALPGARSRTEESTTLEPGATLLLYTDGLVERRGATLDDGLERLAAAGAVLRTAGPAVLVDGLLHELVADGAADDIAVVAVRLLPAPLRLDLSADPAELRTVRRAVAGWARDAAVDPATEDDLQLAVGEAVANAVEHAYRIVPDPGRVLLETVAEPDGALTVVVTDTGTWRPSPADAGSRGRGLQIIDRLATTVDLRPGPSGTTLRFRLGPPAGAPGRARPGLRPGSEGRPAAVRVLTTPDGRCVEVVGDLDLAGVTSVRETLLGLMAAGGVPTTLDLGRLGSLSSIGVELLVEVVGLLGRQAAAVDVVLPPEGAARRLLDLTGLTGALRATTDVSNG